MLKDTKKDSNTIINIIFTIFTEKTIMVNVCIYLDSETTAQELAISLMENDLAAHASIDKDNNSYVKVNGNVLKESIYVLTLQTKALLFDKIVKFTVNKCGTGIRIYSLPITQCNEVFADAIRNNTERT